MSGFLVASMLMGGYTVYLIFMSPVAFAFVRYFPWFNLSNFWKPLLFNVIMMALSTIIVAALTYLATKYPLDSLDFSLENYLSWIFVDNSSSGNGFSQTPA